MNDGTDFDSAAAKTLAIILAGIAIVALIILVTVPPAYAVWLVAGFFVESFWWRVLAAVGFFMLAASPAATASD